MKKLFVTVLIIRLLLSFLPAMQIDMGAWQAWAMRMVSVGPQNFYSAKIFTDNPPGYLYIFWVIGAVREYLAHWPDLTNWLNNGGFIWLLKLPGNLFDLGTGLIIYKIIKGKMGEKGNWPARITAQSAAGGGFLLYTLNPAIWFNASVFGQFDGAGAFFGLLAVYLLLEPISQISQIRLICAGAALAAAWAVKPQAIALAPAVFFLGVFQNKSLKILKFLKLIGVFVLTTLLLYWPFFPKNPLSGVFYVFSAMNNIYFCTTCFAFNFWGIWGNWLDDRILFLGLPLLWWGIGMAIVSMGAIFLNLLCHPEFSSGSVLKEKRMLKQVQHDEINYGKIYLAIALSIMTFNMFVTRMHERYVLPFFAFFLIAAILLKSKKLMLFYLFFSGFNLLNVYYPYASYNTSLHLTPGLVLWLGENFRLLSMVGFGSFLVLLWWYCHSRESENSVVIARSVATKQSRHAEFSSASDLVGKRILKQVQNDDDVGIATPRSDIGARNVIVFLLVFVSFFIRVIRLDIPRTYYFDEVYHAFTAVEMEKGNKMAWEWWNAPPKGFAYEWTHPPLAKEMMVVGIGGIRVMREMGGMGLSDAFGWRIPGVLAGTGVIFLIYLLGKQLFNTRAGLIAAFLGSLDGLLFTQSRIGMNDIYFLFFMLLAFYLFIKHGAAVAHRQFSAVQNPATGGDSLRSFRSSKIGERPVALLILMGVALGLALAGKWTAVYGIGILGGMYIGSWMIDHRKKTSIIYHLLSMIGYFIIIPISVYLLTYLPFFTSGHSWAQFDELQRQMWWYHTGLKATHPYTSPWYSWPLMQRPVWYYVDYGISQISQIGEISKPTIANIYGMGNPVIWWAGIIAIAIAIFNLQFSIFKMIKSVILRRQPKNLMRSFASLRMTSLFIVLLGYFGFFLPWALSPRIMFLYHYLPSLPFLCLALGWGLGKIWERGEIGRIRGISITGKLLTFLFLLFSFLLFLYFYPQLVALPVPKWWSDQYFWFKSWR